MGSFLGLLHLLAFEATERCLISYWETDTWGFHFAASWSQFSWSMGTPES